MRTLARAAGAALVALWCLAPLLWQVATSLKPAGALTRLPPLLPADPTTVHYVAIFADQPFARVIANSAIVAAATTAIALTIGAAAAFALAKLPVRRRGAVVATILAASMFPPIATVSPLYLLIRAIGLRDTLAALVLTYTTFSLPMAIFVLTHFFREIPDDLYRAARVDGCTAWGAFRRVMVPLAAPGFAAAGILVFIFSWNEFLYALSFTTSARARTIPVAIALFPGIHEVPWGEIAAATVVVTAPAVAFAFAFQRRIAAGLTAGAVKG